ncbi:putative major facilitator superfamily transporter [Gordonia araii NBRC 100433]|uniref:Putative major facilitator superfamily transporter n=1 Tax=Gordonia araii NBRC 100433 TaxID=1073574 RepID=G7GYF0_9ACTN|nr:MFS transporter [Gordonia araii]NNG97378.1 MFS transporter [Gordonia araii NBRC 100433]GAB08625.1 putative major facilitator superfamily transporter [Gordonia araii NBRC 100433]
MTDTVDDAPSTPATRERSDHPQRWAFGYLLSLLALALGVSGLPSPLYPIYQEQWGLSPLTITVVFAVYAIGALASALTVGPISDAIGRKPVLITAALAILTGLGLFLIAGSAWQLIVARFLHGAAIGAITVVSGAALLDVRPRDGARNGMVSGVALNVGIAVTALGAAAAAQWSSIPLRLPFAIVAAVVALMLVALIALVEPHVGKTGDRIRIARPSVPSAIRTDFAFSGIGIFTSWSVLGVFLSLYPALTQHATGHPSVIFVGVVISVMAAASAVSQWLSGRFNPRKTAVVGNIGMIVSLLCAIWALHTGLTWFVIADSVALGAAFGLAFGGSLRHLNAVTPADARGRVMSAYYLLGYLAMAIPTVTAGALASRFGTAAIFPWFVVAVAVASLVAAIVGLRSRDRPATIVDIDCPRPD